MDLNFAKFVEWGFLGLIAGILGLSVKVLQNIFNSIVKLNAQVGILLERTEWHDRSIGSHENRITKLEARKGK